MRHCGRIDDHSPFLVADRVCQLVGEVRKPAIGCLQIVHEAGELRSRIGWREAGRYAGSGSLAAYTSHSRGGRLARYGERGHEAGAGQGESRAAGGFGQASPLAGTRFGIVSLLGFSCGSGAVHQRGEFGLSERRRVAMSMRCQTACKTDPGSGVQF
jgi:hypothetical protein